MGGLDVKYVLKPIGTLAAVLTLIQGLLWTILCILAILVYNKVIELSLTDSKNSDQFIFTFVSLYFTGATSTNATIIEGVTTAEDVLIWMCVYLGFSVIWVVACIIWLADLYREGRPPISMYLWCGATGLILILDLTATIWFATDLASMTSFVNNMKLLDPLLPGRLNLLLAPALMMTMAARGFVLYLLNAGLFAMVVAIAIKMAKKKPVGRALKHKTSFANPAMNTTWPERDNTLSSMGTSWETRPPVREVPRYPTYVNPPMSPTYEDMPPRSQPPFMHLDPPKPRIIPPAKDEPKYNIPEPDYSPVMSRAQPMLPLRPALKKTSPHVGRTVF